MVTCWASMCSTMPSVAKPVPAPTSSVVSERSSSAAASAVLWDAAQQIRLAETRTLGRLVRWRIPGTPARLTYDQLFRSYPFTVLDEGERHLVSGLCGRIWTLQRDYPALGDRPAYCRRPRRWTRSER